MSSDELLQVARGLRKDETPDTFHAVVCELGRRGTEVDFEALGRGEAPVEGLPGNILFRQLGALGRLGQLFAVELGILLVVALVFYLIVF